MVFRSLYKLEVRDRFYILSPKVGAVPIDIRGGVSAVCCKFVASLWTLKPAV